VSALGVVVHVVYVQLAWVQVDRWSHGGTRYAERDAPSVVWPSMSGHGDDIRAVPSLMTERVEGATFTAQAVRLDGRRFASCTFDGCSIVYAGGPTEVVGCAFNDCVWKLEGQAANTVTLLGALGASDGMTGGRLVTNLFPQLRRMSGEVAAIPEQASTPERLGVGAAVEVRIGDVTITTSTGEAGARDVHAAETHDEASPPADEAPNGKPRRRAPSGRWIFASGDLAWIVIAAGVVLASVVLGRTGG